MELMQPTVEPNGIGVTDPDEQDFILSYLKTLK